MQNTENMHEPNRTESLLVDSAFYKNAADLIAESRKIVASTANTVICVTNFGIGRMIVQEEQKGQNRAKYGTTLIKALSEYLTRKYSC